MRNAIKKSIAGIYSAAAQRFYEPIVVRRAFPLLGGDLNALVLQHGHRAIEAARGLPILDVPVGTAYFTTEVAGSYDGVVVGADIAWGMAAETRRAALRANLDNLLSVQADAHHLPFADNTFGAILCSNGLQVMPGLRETLRELARVLHPRGTLLVSVVGLPLGAALPGPASRRLPAILRSGHQMVDELAACGLAAVSYRRERLAYLIEAITAA